MMVSMIKIFFRMIELLHMSRPGEGMPGITADEEGADVDITMRERKEQIRMRSYRLNESWGEGRRDGRAGDEGRKEVQVASLL